MKAIRFIIILSLLSSLSSCELLSLISDINSPTHNLSLDANWRCNLLGSVIVYGDINNRGNSSVSKVTLRAKVYNKHGALIKTKTFVEYVDINSKCSIYFRENLFVDRKIVSRVETSIVSSY